MTPIRRACALACAAALLASKAAGQPASSASGSDMPMADYLGLLEQIAPAARDGAQAYVQTFQQRCGRVLTTAELRRAISEGSGDPALMTMIRASQARDAKAIAEAGQRIDCGGRR
jgi:hypothetical protein